ncbi:MAG TPA: hypothetical protein VK703_10815 [Candidatus Acidoferrales bacterium]|nr:hypothetical protein [Candidatus Acidoferrales bacterium]
MSELKTTTSNSWSGKHAAALAVFSLLLGISGGWLIRRSVAAQAPASAGGAGFRTERRIRPDGSGEIQLKQAADAQTAPLLQQLKADPQNAALLAQVGNPYYDAKQYPAAIIYYEPSLKLQPPTHRWEPILAQRIGTPAMRSHRAIHKGAGHRADEARHTFQSWYCKVAG